MNAEPAKSNWEKMVESGEVELVDPDVASDLPLPSLSLPAGMSTDSILDDLRGDH